MARTARGGGQVVELRDGGDGESAMESAMENAMERDGVAVECGGRVAKSVRFDMGRTDAVLASSGPSAVSHVRSTGWTLPVRI